MPEFRTQFSLSDFEQTLKHNFQLIKDTLQQHQHGIDLLKAQISCNNRAELLANNRTAPERGVNPESEHT